MKTLVRQLAERLSMESFIVDAAGGYDLCIDGHALRLEPLGTQMVVRSTLEAMSQANGELDLEAVRQALRMATAWARNCPQALALDPQGRLVLEARLDMRWRDLGLLERTLGAQVGILEALGSFPLQAVSRPKWSSAVWLP
ncbi:YscB family type III secretion system chaperone [Pseudomonas sp. MWU13-3659]|uniref:YscB family type III secretion system chaperone n=1 Tax=Pseudomonas sp. MWU13-3659 TaxID=2986964 RepID=UPI0020752EF7|nr:YscB family type III secretion system chaperone [Pseudomonas sp. MWU13-3659]